MKIKGAFPVRWAAQDGKDGRSYERRYLSLSTSTVPSAYNPNTNISVWSSTITAIDESKRYRFVTERSSVDGGSSWSQWSTPQIDAYLAENGTSFAVKGAAVGVIAYNGSLPASPEVGVYLDQRPSTNDIIEYNGSSWSGSNVAIGDAYILDGNLYVKSRDASTSASVLRWKDAGSIRGPQGEAGKDAVILDLDNENDSILYDGADNPISTPVESQASLYKGAGTVSSGVTYRIISVSGATMMNSGNATSGSYDREDYPSAVWISTSGKVTVNGLTSSQCEVLVGAVFNGELYTQKLTVKKLRGVDKYELVCTPSALTYNSTTGQNPQQDVNIKVFRTGQDGVRSLVQSLSTYGLQLRYYWITNGTDAGPTSITDGTAAGYYNGGVTKAVYANYYTAYRYELLNSGGLLLDSETVPISRVSDGIGTPGASAKSIYKNSFLKPSTPSGSSPSGWNNSPTDQTEIKLQAQGDWYLTDDGFLTAPLIGNGQTSVETLSFITTVANQPLFLRLRCNTSSNDRIYIGNVDSVSPTTNYHREMHGSNQDSLDLEITVQNPGTHFICVAYVRGSSGTSEYVKFICGNMYVWKSDALTFNTNGTVATWSTPYKISGKDAAFTTAVKTNLLLQSSFISTRMDKWAVKNGATTSGIDGRNSYHGSPQLNTDCKELLRQVMHTPNGESRLLANTWYTLSFWAKATPYVQIDKYQTSPNYGFAQEACYFAAGVQNTLWVNGYISSVALNAGKSLRVFVWGPDDSWTFNKFVKITSTSAVTSSITFAVPSTGMYHIAAYVYSEPDGHNSAVTEHTATVNWYRIDRGMKMVTYLYPSNLNSEESQATYTCIDTAAGRIKDGEILSGSSPTDNNAVWQLTEVWTRHTLTFKTRSSIPSKVQSFLMRMAEHSNDVYVCMPKIEQGTMATDYCTNDSDVADLSADTLGYPRETGIYNDETVYKWNEDFRDFMDYEFDGTWYRFGVKRKGMIIPAGTPPTTSAGDDNWEVAHRIQTLITDTVFGSNANIGGFMASASRLLSKNGSLFLDGVNGLIRLLHSDGYRWEVTPNGMQTLGIPNGRRIEIDPSGQKEIRIFDDNGNICLTMNGRNESSIDDLFGNSSGFTLNATMPTKVADTLNNPYLLEDVYLTDLFHMEKDGQVKITSNGITMHYFGENTCPAVPGIGIPTNLSDDATIRIVIATYGDSTGKSVISRRTIYEYNYLKDPIWQGYNFQASGYNYDVYPDYRNGGIALELYDGLSFKTSVPAGYHRIYLELNLSVENGRDGSGHRETRLELLSTSYTFEFASNMYMARMFANGVAFGASKMNSFVAINGNNGMEIFANCNDQSGISLKGNNLHLKFSGQWYKVSKLGFRDYNNAYHEVLALTAVGAI